MIRKANAQNDGKIIAAGTAAVKFAVARYNANGSLDSGFGDNGTLTTAFSDSASFEQADALLLQPDGKIVAAGYSIVLRFRLRAAPLQFGRNGRQELRLLGKVTTDFLVFSSDEATAYALAIQSDGKIIATSRATISGLKPDAKLWMLSEWVPFTQPSETAQKRPPDGQT
ncbi:MAG: delta-60 repeat domain-containing protein [Blastocatellia bacterium]